MLGSGKNIPISEAEKKGRAGQNRGPDPALVSKAMGGDRQALEDLVKMHWGNIYRMMYYRTFSRPDAEDLTQEVFLRAFTRLGQLKDGDAFRPWLYRIAVNLARDHGRKKILRSIMGRLSTEEPLDNQESETQTTPSNLDILLRKEFWDQVRRFTQSLPRRQREVFLLRFMDHLTVRETAQVLNKSESTVKTHLYRAIARFQQQPDLIQLLRED